jgi:hypothetical protein
MALTGGESSYLSAGCCYHAGPASSPCLQLVIVEAHGILGLDDLPME